VSAAPAAGGLVVWTVGHGRLGAEELAARLRAAGVRQVADVRRRPASRRHPWLAGPALARGLARAGLGYRWLGEALGGLRPRPAAPEAPALEPLWWGYAAHMQTEAFLAGVAALLAWAREAPTALLCAEGDPARCHRTLLADHLALAEGVTVRHLLPDGGLREHRPHPAARAQGGRVRYDRVTLSLPWDGGPAAGPPPPA